MELAVGADRQPDRQTDRQTDRGAGRGRNTGVKGENTGNSSRQIQTYRMLQAIRDEGNRLDG